jgi:prefoldin alpha subunit
MVPLTLSMYAPGKLKTPDVVTVDIGTGYFVKKTVPEAKAFVERKLKFLDNNIQGIEKEVTLKRRNLEAVVGVMQQKIKMTQSQVANQVAN